MDHALPEPQWRMISRCARATDWDTLLASDEVLGMLVNIEIAHCTSIVKHTGRAILASDYHIICRLLFCNTNCTNPDFVRTAEEAAPNALHRDLQTIEGAPKAPESRFVMNHLAGATVA